MLCIGTPFKYLVDCISVLDQNEIDDNNESSDEDMELPLFDLVTITLATDEFSCSNKLGEGGFGPVYKVSLQNASKMSIGT